MPFLRRLATFLAVLPLMAGTRCIDEREISPAELPLELPPITQTGANTFGFIVDGRIWRDYGIRCNGTFQCDSNKVSVTYFPSSPPEYYIRAGLTTKQRSEHFTLRLNYVKKVGTYNWGPRYSRLPTASIEFNNTGVTPARLYSGYRSRPYSVVVTRLDTVNRIIAGTFSGTFLLSADTTQSITIGDGRFDLRYRK